MAQLFSFLRKEDNKSARFQGGEKKISYDPRLIDKLHGDHRKLLEIYNQIQAAISDRNYPLINDRLTLFRVTLQTHFLTENVRLYAYMADKLASDRTNAQLINEFRQEMYGIGHAVMSFLRKYNKIQFNEVTVPTFKKELDEIGAVLVTRIKHEEDTLYPLYQPSY